MNHIDVSDAIHFSLSMSLGTGLMYLENETGMGTLLFTGNFRFYQPKTVEGVTNQYGVSNVFGVQVNWTLHCNNLEVWSAESSHKGLMQRISGNNFQVSQNVISNIIRDNFRTQWLDT